MRRWVVERDGTVVELVSCWFPMELVAGTDLADSAPLMVSVRESLRHLKQVRFQMVKETTAARLPSADEAAILGVKKSTPVLAISAGVYDGVQPVCAVDLVLPGDSNELRDTYSVL